MAIMGENMPAVETIDIADPTRNGHAAATHGPIEAPDDPHRLARIFLEETSGGCDLPRIRRWRDEWYFFARCVYRGIAEADLRAKLTASAKAEMDRQNLEVLARANAESERKRLPETRKVTARLISDVAHALTSMTIVPSHVDTPTWLIGEPPFPANEILLCKNGIVHLPSFAESKDYFAPSTPALFSCNGLEFNFEPDAPTPIAWIKFLSELWPDDPQSVQALQEWMGYCLLPDTSQQKIMLMIGPKRSGRGTIARVLRGLVGKANYAGPQLSTIGGPFGLQELLGRTVAVIGDARLSPRTDPAVVAERLLSISGEDAITVDRKFLPSVTAHLPVRFTILTNELPKVLDASGAFASRLLILRFTHSWYDREDTTLTSKLLRELPSILKWAIDGWKRLRARGHFVQPQSGRDLVDEMADLSSPISAFVRDKCRIGPGGRVEHKLLFEAWKEWCQEQGRDHPGDAATFGRNLRAAVPGIGQSRPRGPDGTKIRYYEGVCLA
jgi:putative DNA primase/helicase